MGSFVKCDVGIVSYRCFDRLSMCLESLLSMERPFPGKVLVFENGPEGFPSSLEKRFPQVTFRKNRQNLGFARTCNEIIKASVAPYICFLNPDTVLKRPFLGRAMHFLECNREVAVVGPRIVNPDGTVQESARGFPRLSTAFFGRTCLLTRFMPSNPVSKRNLQAGYSSAQPIEVDWVTGACMVVRRRAIREVGGFDEGFFMYWEDCDWCTRFRSIGWKVLYHPGLGPIEHHSGSSSKKARLKSHFWFHKSAVRLYLKYDVSPFHLGSVLAVAGGIARFLMFLPMVIASME